MERFIKNENYLLVLRNYRNEIKALYNKLKNRNIWYKIRKRRILLSNLRNFINKRFYEATSYWVY